MSTCQAKTKTGKPCSRKASDGHMYCAQHQKLNQEVLEVNDYQTEEVTSCIKSLHLSAKPSPVITLPDQLGETYTVLRKLGQGTAGSVYLVQKDQKEEFAIKIQSITTKNIQKFKSEVRNQERFGKLGLGPKVIAHNIDTVTEGKQGYIIMELIDGELDKWLNHKQTEKDLDDMIAQLASHLTTCKTNKIIHGDLALFNIAKNLKGQWIFIDFDRACIEPSLHKQHHHVDALRLVSEICGETSDNTARINKFNLQYLQKHAPLVWGEAIGFDIPTEYNAINQAWNKSYGEYCKAAKIPCLGE